MGRNLTGVASRSVLICLIVAGIAVVAFLLWPVDTRHPMNPEADQRDRDRSGAIGLVILLIDYWDAKGENIQPVDRVELESWAGSRQIPRDSALEALKRTSFQWEVNPSFIGKRYEDVPDDEPLVFLRGHPSASGVTAGGRLIRFQPDADSR